MGLSYGRQWLDDDDIKAVEETLRSDFLTTGPRVAEFEQRLCARTGAKYAVVVSSGTAALHLACMAAGLGSGDEGVTSSISFLASAGCMALTGADVRFADIEPATYNIDAEQLAAAVSDKTKVVIPVHFAGLPADMERIAADAKSRGIVVIEDACHALGAEYKGTRIGDCAYSAMAAFSFHPVKNITTGEGGAVTTNSAELCERLRLLRNHGMTKSADDFTNAELAFTAGEQNPWYYEVHEVGPNYRLTDVQCALGISQLGKLDRFLDRRREIVAAYADAFREIPWLAAQSGCEGRSSAHHLYVVQIDFARLGKSRLEVMKELRGRGVGTQVHYIPLHLQPYYAKRGGCKRGDFPTAESYYERCLSLPLYPAMADADVKTVITAIRELEP